MYNKKVLKKITSSLDKAKKPAVPKDIIVDPKGQWNHPGKVTRIPASNITMQGVNYPVMGVPNIGMPVMMYPGQDYDFPGADYVDEYPQMQDGGEQDGMNAMMKARLAYANEFGNPAAKRMINLPDNLYQFDNGDTGTHYMASMDNYAVPQIQNENGQLMLGDYGPESNEAMRFESDEDANYFAKHYKDVSPGFMEMDLSPEEIEEYAKGGFIIEDISVPELIKAAEGMVIDPLPLPTPAMKRDSLIIEQAFKKADPFKRAYLAAPKKDGKTNVNLVNKYVNAIVSDKALIGARSRLSKINKEDPLKMIKVNGYNPDNPSLKVQGAFTFKPFTYIPPKPDKEDKKENEKKETKVETKNKESVIVPSVVPAQQTVSNTPDPNRKVIGERSITTLDANGKPVTTIEYVYENQIPTKQTIVPTQPVVQPPSGRIIRKPGDPKYVGPATTTSVSYPKTPMPYNNALHKNGGELNQAQNGKTVKHTDKKGNTTITVTDDDGTQYIKVKTADGKVYNKTVPAMKPMSRDEFMQTDYYNQRNQFPVINQKSETLQNSAAQTGLKTDQRSVALRNKASQEYHTMREELIPMMAHKTGMSEDDARRAVYNIDTDVDALYNKYISPNAGRPDTIKKFVPRAKQKWDDKAMDILFNPMTAAGHWMRGQEVPDYLQESLDNGTYGYWANGVWHTERNPFDVVTDNTPIGAVHAAKNIYDRATDNVDGNFWTAENAMDAANIIPTAALMKGMKGLKGFRSKSLPLDVSSDISRITSNSNRALDLGSDVIRPFKSTQAGLTTIGDLTRQLEPIVNNEGRVIRQIGDPKYTETGLQKFIGNTGATAKTASKALDEQGLLNKSITQDDIYSQQDIERLKRVNNENISYEDFDWGNQDENDDLGMNMFGDNEMARIFGESNQLRTPPNEIYLPDIQTNPVSRDTRMEIVNQRAQLKNKYDALGLDNYPSLEEAPENVRLRAFELEKKISDIDNFLDRARQKRIQQLTSTPGLNDILAFRNQPGYINSTTPSTVNGISSKDLYQLRADLDRLNAEAVDLLFNSSNKPKTPEQIARAEEVNNQVRKLRTEINNRTSAAPAGQIDLTRPRRNSRGVIDITDNQQIQPIAEPNPFFALQGDRTSPHTIPRRTSRIINSNTVPGTPYTIAETLSVHDNPLNVVNEVRRLVQDQAINSTTASDLMNALRGEIRDMPIDSKQKKFFISEATRISKIPKDVVYTGSAKPNSEIYKLSESWATTPEEREAIQKLLVDNYGYSLDDLEGFIDRYATSDLLINVFNNQVYDDVRYVLEHGVPNPNLPVFNRRTGEISPLLKNQTELHQAGLSKDVVNKIEDTMYTYSMSNTTGTVNYSQVQEPIIHKLKDNKLIAKTEELDGLISSYETAISKLGDGELKENLTRQLEDYKGTKWLRTEYADELKAQGLKPNKIEKASIISNSHGQKNLVDGDGNIIGTLNAYKAKTHEGTQGYKIGSTGVNYKFHPYNLKHSKFENWDEAQDFLENEEIEKLIATITNESDKTNPIVLKHFKRQAKAKAKETVKRLQENNENRYGEALYRGVHHAVKDTKGAVFTDQHFVNTKLPDPFTGEIINRKRAEDYWNSQAKQYNEAGIPKSEFVNPPPPTNAHGYGTDEPHIIIRRQQGGDLSKLNKFIH
jgi:hypothetical protein